MNRRHFLRTLACVPALPLVALAGPTPAGATDITTQRFLFRVSGESVRERFALVKTVRKWEAEGCKPSLVLPDNIEVFRL